MRFKLLSVLTLSVLGLVGCRGGEKASVTGAYGSGVMSGTVVMANGGSPAGVEVSVRGTGMTTTLGAAGEFAFAGVPAEADLDFRRNDGIAASMGVDGAATNMVIELAQTTARKATSRRRGAGRGVPALEYEGLIVSASAEQIVVFTSKKEEVTIGLKPETVIRKGGRMLTAADLVEGTRVHVKALKVEDALSAIQVIVQRLPGEDDGEDDGEEVVRSEYEGIVVSSAADQLVIFDSHRNEETFLLTAETVIRKGGTPVLATDIKPGWRVHVKSTAAEDGTKTALLVIVQNDRDDEEEGDVSVSGTVGTVGATDLTLETRNGVITVQVDASTRIEKKKQSIALTDVRSGDRVTVEGTRVDAVTILAKEIKVK